MLAQESALSAKRSGRISISALQAHDASSRCFSGVVVYHFVDALGCMDERGFDGRYRPRRFVQDVVDIGPARKMPVRSAEGIGFFFIHIARASKALRMG